MDGSWAPQSPDLDTTYYSADTEVHPQHRAYRGSTSHQLPTSPPASSPLVQYKPELPVIFMPQGLKQEEQEGTYDVDYTPDASVKSERSKGKRPKDGNRTGALPSSTSLPGTEHINITVHFPVARIKRIMQADDDVGKVAQVTPVVVSKALELFMISLVTKAATEAKARNSKRVGAGHLKQAITKDEQFDFLSDIMSKVADAPAAAGKTDADTMDVDGKKPRKAPGRRRKKADDDDF